jgi:hypothetical protein
MKLQRRSNVVLLRGIKLDKQNNALEVIQMGFAEALLNVDLTAPALPIFAASTASLEARLAFYRGNQTAIWTNALASAYPVLLKLVGTEFFEQMSRAYGLAFPSQLGDLNHFGADLAKFLANAPVNKDFPYFANVAALEWQVHRAYYAADAEVLTLPSLIAGAGEKLHDARLNWHPAAQLFESSNASVSVWSLHQEGIEEKAQFDLSERNYGLITRCLWKVSVIVLSEADFCALQALSQHKSLGAALESALDVDSNFNISNALNSWFSAGTFSNFEIL